MTLITLKLKATGFTKETYITKDIRQAEEFANYMETDNICSCDGRQFPG